jgi:hypothetical protein
MPTSGVITGTMTVRQICTMAARIAAGSFVSEGQPALTAYDASVALECLNWMLKSMQADGLRLWREEEIEITWTADEPSLELGRNYLDIIELRQRDANDRDRTLTRIDWIDYTLIANKTQSGEPVNWNFGRGIDIPIVTLWPVPTTDITLLGTGSRIIEDVLTLDENIDVPQEWTEMIVFKLAERWDFASGWAASATAQMTARKADQLYRLVRDDDAPASFFISPA